MSDGQSKQPEQQLWLVPREGQSGHDVVAEIAVEVRTPRTYSYAVPEPLREQVQAGVCVLVPYGRAARQVPGICVRCGRREWDHTLKPITELTSAEPVLTQPLIELGLWISEYYACSPGLTLAALVPAAAREKRLKKVTYLRATGLEPATRLTPKQSDLLAALAEGELRRDQALRTAGVGLSVANTLSRRGLVESIVREELAESRADWDHGDTTRPIPPESPEDAYVLTPAQQAALERISALTSAERLFRVFLLFGVPGSGKTEVYVRAIRRVIAAGRQAILLVPEIALATQVVDRLARRFGRVAVLHSRLRSRARRETHRAIAAGRVDVVIGTRSAVFAPCPRLGLLVVDEEQDGSFKSLAAPLYHARDVAIKRAQIEHVPVVLGTATPALETWHNAETLPHYQLLRLPERVGRACLPEVRVIESRQRELGQTTTVLSTELADRLGETLDASQQAILLLNRRGYAVYLRCIRCRMAVSCPCCGGHMVYHQADKKVRCHRCGVSEDVPRQCLDETCGGKLERSGLAIQRLQEELEQTFPKARLLRLDSDTMRRREDYVEALEQFEAGRADILLGTQMVAKGLDFPNVRLVGVIEADAALSLPDFRAGEHVFQLVMQVVGRAGRRAGGSLALVESTPAGTAIVRQAVRMDYESFARRELVVRQRFFYPPFARLARMILADRRPGRARDEARRLTEQLRDLAGRIHPRLRIGDAEPCIVQRLREMLRFQVLVRGPRDDTIQRLLHEAGDQKLLSPRVQRFNIDVDPVDLL